MEFRNKLKQRLTVAVSYVVLGLALVIAGAANHFENYFFSSFGCALIVMGILRIVRYRKITRDDKTVRKQELAESDERTRMISEKAKTWVFSLSVTGSGILVIILNLLGHQQEALPVAWFVCAMIGLYWLCYLILQKKY